MFLGIRSAVLAFALGVLLLQQQAALPAGARWALGALLPLCLLWHRRGRVAQCLCWIMCIAIGFGWAAWRGELRLADALPAAWEGKDIEVVGVVAAMPQGGEGGERFEFAVETVLTAQAEVPEYIQLVWYRTRHEEETAPLPALRAGERWRLAVRLKRPHGGANPHGFDYEAWLLERNVRATGYVRPAGGERLAAAVSGVGYSIERWRQAVRDRFLSELPPERYPWAGILVALAVGDQRAIPSDLWPTFSRTGTTHALSISGLHVTMVAALFAAGVAAVWRRIPALALRWPAQSAALLGGLLAALAYTLLAGFAVPAQRTVYMLAVAVLAMLSGRVVAVGKVLALALLAVLLLDPFAVLAVGTWLSFGAVAALLYVGAAQVGTPRGWRQRLQAWRTTQWTATLASLPILLLVFQQCSLVSPLANALAVPVIGLLITPLALLGALLPWPLLALAHALLGPLIEALGWLARWPVWQAPAPPLWAAVAAAIGVAVCLLPRGIPGRWLGGLLLLPALAWPPERPPQGAARFVLLDVGQGLAGVVLTRHHALVYDPGPRYGPGADAGGRVVVPYLRALGIDALDRLVVTHRDSDHAGGLDALRQAVSIGDLRSSMAGIGALPCLAGEHWQWDGVDFEFLHPVAADFTVDRKSNHLSCVLRVTAGGRRLLLTADIEAEDELALLDRQRGDLAADVLLVPHHGSRTSSLAPFIAAVQPTHALIPVGYLNRFGHPKAEVIQRYAERGVRLWRTDRDGALIVDLATDGVNVSAWRAEHARYWHGR